MNTLTPVKHNDGAELRRFAFTLAVGFGILSLLLFWKRSPVAVVPAILTLALVAVGLVRSEALRGVRDGWMRVATLMGSVMSYVVLTMTFFLVLTPTGCVMRIMGRDPLARSMDPSAKSYWIVKAQQEQMPEQYEKMY